MTDKKKDLKEPLQSAIMTGYNLSKARKSFIEYSDHALDCSDQVVADAGDDLYHYEMSPIQAKMRVWQADMLAGYAEIHRELAELNSEKGYPDITNADFAEHGVVNR